ncbi:hypothetical protein HAX54_011634 [Datura stramonium]|uniref:Uncharacterized protein n=1 Tax=Datura stramonium TaxID=4076 RepID=A0ABS8TIF2_DATST|nr:hypothetical protein [Datura stramonium]
MLPEGNELCVQTFFRPSLHGTDVVNIHPTLETLVILNASSDDGTSLPNDAALLPVQAMSRYVHRESNCLSVTGRNCLPTNLY